MPFKKSAEDADFKAVAERLGMWAGDGKSIKGFSCQCQCPGRPVFKSLQGLAVHHGRIHK
jgi:hypothetical protein